MYQHVTAQKRQIVFSACDTMMRIGEGEDCFENLKAIRFILFLSSF